MITTELVEHVAKLARLKLSEQEKATYTEQMAKIIEYFDELASIDTAGVEPMSHALPVLNVMREDEIVAPPGHEVMLKTAPDKEDSFFRVPKI
jgi:aspartyl-tRNA(Asn)/glutamyl-tRNA(Gln) amidotransferase subunit C